MLVIVMAIEHEPCVAAAADTAATVPLSYYTAPLAFSLLPLSFCALLVSVE